MKRLLITILFLSAVLPLPAQLYHPGEQLFYRVSYKAKMFPNTEVGAVEVKTSDSEIAGRKYYKVEGIGRTLPTYRWFFNLEDIYTVWIDLRRSAPYVSKATCTKATIRSRATTTTTGRTIRSSPAGAAARNPIRRKPCR